MWKIRPEKLKRGKEEEAIAEISKNNTPFSEDNLFDQDNIILKT